MNIHIIRADGTEERVSAQFGDVPRLIGAAVLDTVNLRDGRVMCVDDEGYETERVNHGDGSIELRPTCARKPANAKATMLYHGVCVAGTTHQIVGDVAIVVDAES